jgi:hypothetical protein
MSVCSHQTIHAGTARRNMQPSWAMPVEALFPGRLPQRRVTFSSPSSSAYQCPGHGRRPVVSSRPPSPEVRPRTRSQEAAPPVLSPRRTVCAALGPDPFHLPIRVERSGRRREVQFEPVRQVLDLTVHGGGHGPVEGHVLVDRLHPQHPGLAVGGGVELAHQPVAVQDR